MRSSLAYIAASVSTIAALGIGTGCGDNNDPSAVTPDATTTPSTLDAAAVDASPPDAGAQAVTVTFDVRVGADTANCATTAYSGLGTAASEATLNDARFYVSNVRLLSGTDETSLELTQDGKWQYMDVALLDFEDGSNGCATNGNGDMNATIVGTVLPGNYNGIVFDLGVPYALNHEDVTAAPSPLNVMAMYWAWAIGHKFLRVDLALTGGGGWNVHLGSQACDSATPPTAPPASGCDKPNRPSIRLTDFNPADDVIVFDLAKLVEDSDLNANAGNAPGCQSFPDDADDCIPLFPNLGLSFDTGDCVENCGNQDVFSVE